MTEYHKAIRDARAARYDKLEDELDALPRKETVEDVAEKTGGPNIEDVAEATQTGFELQNRSWLLGYAAGRVSIEDARAELHNTIEMYDKMVGMYVTASNELEDMTAIAKKRGVELDKLTAKIARITDLMEDPDPYRQDLGPDGTFNVPCVLVSDLEEALDG
jgi:hypothetical protein